MMAIEFVNNCKYIRKFLCKMSSKAYYYKLSEF